MADSLSDTISRLTTAAQILVSEEPNPHEAAQELNAAAMNAGIVDVLLSGTPNQIVLDLMSLPRMSDHLIAQEVNDRSLPSKAGDRTPRGPVRSADHSVDLNESGQTAFPIVHGKVDAEPQAWLKHEPLHHSPVTSGPLRCARSSAGISPARPTLQSHQEH